MGRWVCAERRREMAKRRMVEIRDVRLEVLLVTVGENIFESYWGIEFQPLLVDESFHKIFEICEVTDLLWLGIRVAPRTKLVSCTRPPS